MNESGGRIDRPATRVTHARRHVPEISKDRKIQGDNEWTFQKSRGRRPGQPLWPPALGEGDTEPANTDVTHMPRLVPTIACRHRGRPARRRRARSPD